MLPDGMLMADLFANLDPGTRIWLSGHDRRAKAWVQRRVGAATRPAEGPIDLAIVAPRTLDEGLYLAEKIASRLTPTGRLMLVWSDRPDDGSQQASFDESGVAASFAQQGWAACETASVTAEAKVGGWNRGDGRSPAFPPELRVRLFLRAPSKRVSCGSPAAPAI